MKQSLHIPSLKTAHILKDTDLSRQEILSLYQLTNELRRQFMKDRQRSLSLLEGRTLGMIFEKNSTRTRVSFQVGMYQLGGNAIHLTTNDIQLGRGESMEDTARVLSRYLDAIMIRSNSQEKVDVLAANSQVPVINGLTDIYHPCQALTDYYTVAEHLGPRARVGYIGDAANNVAISLAYSGAILGYDLVFISPQEYSLPEVHKKEVVKLMQVSGGTFTETDNAAKGVLGCQVLYTDVWVSMGMEKEAELRKKKLEPFSLTSILLQKAETHPYIMHCLPAKWGEEIQPELQDYDRNLIYEQAENRMHVQKAILVSMMLG